MAVRLTPGCRAAARLAGNKDHGSAGDDGVGAYPETLQYNANLQLVRLAAGGAQGIDFTYTYPAGNNGRISQMTDNISGEQVSYTYDQLNRLVQSVSTVTGTMPFAYDGFGNLTQQGQTTLSIDATTNRINSAGYQYNANGNVTQTPNPTTTYAYDVANRLVSNNAIYNPRNQRVFDETYIYLYTPDGKLAGKYTANWSTYGSVAIIQGNQPNVYFAGKLIQEQGQWVMTDRLGSVRLNGSGARSSYLPYRAEVTPTSDQRTKFATYYRESAGLDYAGQRYYSNVSGRFLTPDPGGTNTADLTNPTSLNRYAYANDDPVDFYDLHGLFAEAPPDSCYQNTAACLEYYFAYYSTENPNALTRQSRNQTGRLYYDA
jgi:RHS repeat-associated protein